MITAFSNHPNLKCRIAYFDILIWLFDNIKASENDVVSLSLRRELLKGLTDESQFIRGKLGNFWNKSANPIFFFLLFFQSPLLTFSLMTAAKLDFLVPLLTAWNR